MDSDGIPLASADRGDEYAHLSPKTGRLRIVTGGRPVDVTFRGIFGRTHIGPVAFYRASAGLYLQSEQLVLHVIRGMSASVAHEPGNARTLEISLAPNSSVRIAYEAEPRWRSELERIVDFTWTEEEDFDFGLRIANVINSPQRFSSFFGD